MNQLEWMEAHHPNMVVGESHKVPCTNCFGPANTSASTSSADTFCSTECRTKYMEKSRIAKAMRARIDSLIDSLSEVEQAYLKRKLRDRE